MAENGVPSMSQAAAQSAIKKPAEDSLSPFSSDNEDAKPRKSKPSRVISHKQLCLIIVVLIMLLKLPQLLPPQTDADSAEPPAQSGT